MKHPALARVFSVVLAILALLMLVNGVKGFGKADAEAAERTAFSEKYAQRIETYRQLDEELAHSISYEEAWEELERLQEQHDADASQHRTDVAMYSAEKGGYTMGADMIWEAMPEVKGAKQQLVFAKAELEQKEKIYAENKGTINSTIAAANNGAAACAAESGKLDRTAKQIAAMAAQLPPEPTEPVEPTKPGAPSMPAAPLIITDEALAAAESEAAGPDPDGFIENYIAQNLPDFPEDTPEEEIEAAREALRPAAEAALQSAAAQAVNAYNELKALYEGNAERQAAYDAEMAAYEEAQAEYESRMLQYESDMEAYEQALTKYQSDLQAYREAQGSFQQQSYALAISSAMESGGVLQSLSGDLTSCAGNLGAVAAALGADTASMDSGGGSAGMPGMDQLAGMTPEQIIGTLRGMADAMGGAFGKIASGAAAIGSGIEEARAKVDAAEKQLRDAESQLQGQLENIWYNLGELEKDKEDLEAEKTDLDEEAAALSKRLVEAEELKRIRNRHISTRQLLISVPEVKAEETETGDLVGSAEKYLASYEQESEKLYQGKRVINLLAVIGGAAGVLGIPAAFEKIRKRFFLVAPVLLCLACAVGADALNMRLGLGQMYTALFTAIFALIQLLIILPKNKLPTE